MTCHIIIVKLFTMIKIKLVIIYFRYRPVTTPHEPENEANDTVV